MATTSSVGRETSSGSGQPDAGARHRAEHRQPCYLSIDLEDFAHDYQRSLGVEHPVAIPVHWSAPVPVWRSSRRRIWVAHG